MEETKLTVVIPVHNREKIVGRTLECVVAQTLRPLNVVLVDNGSEDKTSQLLKQWKAAHQAADFPITLLHEPIPGAPAARNCGLRQVTTPYTMFFDSDDLMAPEHCRRAVEGFELHPETDIVGWDVVYCYPGRRQRRRFAVTDCHWNNVHYGSMATQRYAARTELFRRVGGWTAECKGWNDIELGSRLLSATDRIVRLEGAPTVEVVHTDESITGNSFSSGRGKWERSLDLIEGNYRRTYEADSPALKKLLRQLNLRRAILAGDYRKEGSRAMGEELLKVTLAAETSPTYRAIYRLAYSWRSGALPGIAHLLRPLF